MFVLLGAGLIALGIYGRLADHDPTGIFLVAAGALLVLIGVGFQLAFTRFFPEASGEH